MSLSMVVAAFAAIYLAGVLQQVNTRMLEGVGRPGLAAALSVVGPVFTVVSTVVACTMHAPLMVTVILPAFAPLLTGLAGRLALHRLVRETVPESAGSTKGVEAAVALPMIAISLTYAVSYNVDYWLVSALLGVERTGEYAAAARPAQLFLVLASASAPVLWTHFARARVAGESAVLGARAVTRMCIGFLAVGLPAGAAYAGAVGVLGSHLTAGLATPGAPLILAFAVWGVALVSHQPFAMVLNTAPGLRFQLLSMCAAAIVNVSLKLVMTPAFGPAGAVWASCLSLMGVHIPLLAWWVWRSSRRVTVPGRLARLTGDPPAFLQDDEVP
ncbi:lipopolysaccharide biosynthesis protein [Nocardioides coralli]|uniref:lipopolysaccharide biosynthesis protein n=1 Tax=Nocardioides coralli TaxID=2872154 RepID=UPI001CA443D4|nr:hypothetical protein [Nocardioides coralli]QZY28783.1 hypothetical protein K6T13_15205 [Nocardioides coralli]